MKARFVMLSLAAAAMAATACLQENAPESLDALAGKATLNASLEADQTKTALSGTETVVWAEGDVVKVFDETGAGVDYTLTSGAGTSSAVFTSDADAQPQAGLAVYPAAVARKYESGSLELAWPTEIAYAEMALNAPMVATVEDGNASFKHLGGVLKFYVSSIPAEATAFVFKSNVNFTVPELTDVIPGTTECTLGDGIGLSEVKVTFDAGTLKSAYFIIPVPVGTYEGFTVELRDASNAVITDAVKTSEKSLVVDRADILSFVPFDVQTPEGYETIWEGNQALGNWSGSVRVALPPTAVAGDLLRVEFTTEATDAENNALTYWQLALAVPTQGWPKLDIDGLTKDDGWGPMIFVTSSQTYFEIVLTEDLIAKMSSGLIIQGYYCNVKAVLFKGSVKPAEGEVIWDGEFNVGNWSGKLFYMPSKRMAAGDKLRIGFTLDSEATYWQLAVENSSWTKQPIDGLTQGSDPYIALTEGQTSVEFTLTDDLVKQLSDGMVLQGYMVNVTKIEYICQKETKLIWNGPHPEEGQGMSALAYGGFDWSKVEAGQILCVRATIANEESDYPWGLVSLRVGDGWAELTEKQEVGMAPANGSQVLLEYTLSQSNIDEFVAKNGCVLYFDTTVTLHSITLTAK